MLILHKWVVLRMKKKRFGNIYMDRELSATQYVGSVIVGGDLN